MSQTPQPSPLQSPHPIIDIGVNLTHKSFTDDMDQVLERARISGVESLIITGTSIEESRKALELAEKYPGELFTTSGVHPHDASQFNETSYKDLLEIAEHHAVKAIGECGLDFNRMFSPKEEQIHAFEQQIKLATECQKPLFLHERDAHKTQHEILKQYRDDTGKTVIHCFTGSKKEAFNYLDLDLYIGITGWICDQRRGSHLHEFIKDIPLDRLMIETDAPYLTPKVTPKISLQSQRRNEPFTLPYVLYEISKHRPETIETIALNTRKNTVDFFNLGDINAEK